MARNLARRIGRTTATTLMIIGGATTVSYIIEMQRKASKLMPQLSKEAFIEIDLTEPVVERSASPSTGLPLTFLFDNRRAPLKTILDTLKVAQEDKKVVGIVAKINNPGNMAQIQELRDAIKEWNKAGKLSIAFSSSYTQEGYYLASAFQQVMVQPVGTVDLVGLTHAEVFLKGLVDWLGIPFFVSRNDSLKSAPNIVLEKKMTEDTRASKQRLLNSLFSQLVGGIAYSRGLTIEKVMQLIEEGPFLAPDAYKSKLVDGLGYYSNAILNDDKKYRFLSLNSYAAKNLKNMNSDRKAQSRIALIHAYGEIPGDDTETHGELTVKNLEKAFLAAIRDDKVKAIVFRVDSPGGGVLASDSIYNLVQMAKRKGKKVVASFGGVAASGGYYISLPADKIVASPASITGSIGVFSIVPHLAGFLENKLGVTTDYVKRGQNADLLNPMLSPPNPNNEKVLNDHIAAFANHFSEILAKGRGMDIETAKKLTNGDVYTGMEAKELGLVDELGGLNRAVAVAKELANIPDDEEFSVVVLPKQTFLESILGEDSRFWFPMYPERILDSWFKNTFGFSVKSANPNNNTQTTVAQAIQAKKQ